MNPGEIPRVLFALLLVLLIVVPIGPLMSLSSPNNLAKDTQRHTDLVSRGRNAVEAGVEDPYGRLPLCFEANAGQFDSAVKFASRSHAGMLFLTETEAVLNINNSPQKTRNRFSDQPDSTYPKSAASQNRSSVLRMKFLSSNRSARVTGVEELPGRSNYFIWNDPAKWKTNIATFAKVKYEQVYPGVDLVYYGKRRELEYDLIVAPGADPRRIRIAFEGAQSTRLGQDGSLLLTANDQQIQQQPPIAYQVIGGTRQQVDARYVLDEKHRLSFSLAGYRSDLPLIIDPVLAYSTYLGGTDDDVIYGVAVDSSGNSYVTGYTFSNDFPGAASLSHTGINLFVTKLNAAGTAVLYTSIIGGTSDQEGFAIAVDGIGNAYVTGETFSPDFPAINALQSYGGQVDAFIVKLSANGSSLLFSTPLGGSRLDQGNGIAVDNIGATYVTGETFSLNFPTRNATQPAHGGYTSDGFAIKLSPSGSVVYSTYLGGNGTDGGLGIAADSAGDSYITGFTSSSDFNTTNPIQADFKGKNIFISTDAGAMWSDINSGLPAHLEVQGLAVNPSSTSTVYAATTRGIFKSTNSGSNWSLILNPGSGTNFPSVVLDPINPAKVFAVASVGGVYLSTDAGSTWNSPQLFGATNCAAVDPVTPSVVYVGLNRGLLKSTDGGITWNAVPGQISGERILAIAIDPSAPATLYAGTGTGTFTGIIKSTDGGMNWDDLPFPFANQDFNSIAIDPAAPSTIYAANREGAGVMKSTDSGASWTRMVAGLTSPSVWAIALNPTTTSTLYAASDLGVFKSTDGGQQWNASNNGLTSFPAISLAVDPVNSSRIYAGTIHTDDAFITKLGPGGAPVFSTYLGGSNGDAGNAISIDSSGSVYVTGATVSLNFPNSNALQPSLNSVSGDAFVTKLNASGNQIVYSTYFGGSGGDNATAIAVDSQATVWIAGSTTSADLPDVNAFQPFKGGSDAFIVRLDSSGSNILFSTYLGGTQSVNSSGEDAAHSIAVDVEGTVYVAGETGSDDFPTTPAAFQTNRASPFDSFEGWIAKISSSPFVLTPNSKGFSAVGGSGSVNVIGPDGSPWTVASNDSWITIDDPGSGSGNGTVSYTVGPNPSAVNRAGSITIADHTFTVLEGAAFTDVPPASLFYDEIGRLSAHGITFGCGDGKFCPNDPVLRDQMAAFIIRALGDSNPPMPSSQRFTDVPPTNLFYAFIEQMAVRQITSGCGGNNYCPSQPVLREQMAVFVIRSLGEFNPPTPASQRFNDVTPSNLFYNFIDRMAALNITFGCSQSPPLYCPGDSVTRAQMAAFLVRAFNL